MVAGTSDRLTAQRHRPLAQHMNWVMTIVGQSMNWLVACETLLTGNVDIGQVGSSSSYMSSTSLQPRAPWTAQQRRLATMTVTIWFGRTDGRTDDAVGFAVTYN